MITTKNYIWPVIRNIPNTIGGFLSIPIVSVIIAIMLFFQWYIFLVFILITICYYIWAEADSVYRDDKYDLEYKIKEHLAWMIYLSIYWDIDKDRKKSNDSYSEATSIFIKLMEEYEGKYGNTRFYEMMLSDWYDLDKYLYSTLINKTF